MIHDPLPPDGELSAEAAKKLAVVNGLLRLRRITRLGPKAAKRLAGHAGTLDLGCLPSLSAADAELLGRHRDWLMLDGLASLGDDVAKGLALHRGGLSLRGLTAISEEEAEAIARARGDLRLDGISELSPATSKALAAVRGTLSLDGLRVATVDVLAALASHEGGLSLGGLAAIDEPMAAAIARHRGRLWLDGVRDLSPAVAAALATHRGTLSLAGVTTLHPEADAAFRAAASDLRLGDAKPAVDPPADRPTPPRAAAEAAPVTLGAAIIGGGFAGMAMAIGLLHHGRTDFAIFEKAASLGGTWRDNTYPGCACDVPSRLYSYSFANERGWSRSYAPQPEILAYLQGVAEQHSLDRFVRFGTTVERLDWDDSARCWRLTTADGRRFMARVVISAVGGIHIPHVPDLPGLDEFAGLAFHTARWRHDLDLAGRHVAVVGTGASAIQVVPEIAKRCERLTVFQRTPPWILPRGDRPVSKLGRWLESSVPGLRSIHRQWLYWKAEARAIPLARFPQLVVHPQRRARAFMKRCVPELRMRRKLEPTYALGCKRVLKSDDYYAAITRGNVELVVEPIEAIGRWGITTIDGVVRPIDAIVLATGFKPFDLTDSISVSGRHGTSLAAVWRDGPRAFGGVAVPGFPNLFLLMGPNTALGHNSILVMIEAQVNYILQCITWLERGDLAAIEVTDEAERAFNADLAGRFEKSVWRSGPVTGTAGMAVAPCASWYQHASGRNHVIWPGTAASYCRAMARADRRHFISPGGADHRPS